MMRLTQVKLANHAMKKKLAPLRGTHRGQAQASPACRMKTRRLHPEPCRAVRDEGESKRAAAPADGLDIRRHRLQSPTLIHNNRTRKNMSHEVGIRLHSSRSSNLISSRDNNSGRKGHSRLPRVPGPGRRHMNPAERATELTTGAVFGE